MPWWGEAVFCRLRWLRRAHPSETGARGKRGVVGARRRAECRRPHDPLRSLSERQKFNRRLRPTFNFRHWECEWRVLVCGRGVVFTCIALAPKPLSVHTRPQIKANDGCTPGGSGRGPPRAPGRHRVRATPHLSHIPTSRRSVFFCFCYFFGGLLHASYPANLLLLLPPSSSPLPRSSPRIPPPSSVRIPAPRVRQDRRGGRDGGGRGGEGDAQEVQPHRAVARRRLPRLGTLRRSR